MTIKKLNKKILIPICIMAIISIITIYSALTYTSSELGNLALKQGLWYVIGALLVAFLIHMKNEYLYRHTVFLYILGNILLVGLLLFAEPVNNSKCWFTIPGIGSIQPSEFAKSILIIFSAIYYNKLHYRKVKNIYAYLVPLAFGIMIACLVAMQPDLGSAAIIGGIVFLTFISIPMVQNNMIRVIKVLVIGVVIAAIIILYSGSDLLNSMQMDRLTFRNPCSRYTEVTGYQVCNGFIAINNGGLFGVGLGNSTQKYLYLPESHTDFIFPIIVEELGLIFGIILILGYAWMLFRILKIAKASENLRCSVLAYGTFWFLTLHILINLLGILALIPLTGVPLPLLSYGGSFTVNVIVMLFIVQRVNIENKINKTKREIKAL